MRSILAYIGPEAALLEEHQGGACRATDRARRVGADVRALCPDHPLQPLGLPGPASLSGLRLQMYVLGSWVVPRYSPSPVPTRPIPTPVHTPAGTMSTRADTRNSCFQGPVGEPRGAGTHWEYGNTGKYG